MSAPLEVLEVALAQVERELKAERARLFPDLDKVRRLKGEKQRLASEIAALAQAPSHPT